MKSYYYCKDRHILRNPLRFGIKYSIFSEKSQIRSEESQKQGTIEDFIAFCGEDLPEYIDIFHIDDCDLDRLISAFGGIITDFNLYKKDGTLKSLEGLTSAKTIKLNYDGEDVCLWNIKSNTSLMSLKMQFPKCKTLNGVEGLVGSCVSDILLHAEGFSYPTQTEATLFDPTILKNMPSLKEARIYMSTPTDVKGALLSLAELGHLDLLKLHEDTFTFAQFAWLHTKIPNVRGVGGISNFYPNRQKDVTMMMIAGNDRPDLPIYDEDKVNEEFRAACEKYKKDELPPEC